MRRRHLLIGAATLVAVPAVTAMPVDDLAAAGHPVPPPSGPMGDALAETTAAGVPAAVALVRDGATYRWSTAGATRRFGGRAPRSTDRLRIGSLTKTFVATVLLRLAAQGRLDLAAPIARYLPGVVPNGETITIRHLMQHTSGLDDYHRYNGLDSAADYLRERFADPSPQEDLALAFGHPPLFAPGTGWSYTDGNYRVLELLIAALTGTSAGTAVTRQVIRPLRLGGTWYPEHDPSLPGAHLHGYLPTDGPDGPFCDLSDPADFTVESVDQTGAAGAMVSTPADLLCFYAALLGGRLLPAAQMRQMLAAVATDTATAQTGMLGYGLGIAQFDAGDGQLLWGHQGGIGGYTTILVSTVDGSRQAVVAMTLNPLPQQLMPLVVGVLRQALASG